MLAYRLVDVDLAPFVNDEPRILAAARAQGRTGPWLTASALTGSLGVPYGPAAFWFYGLVSLAGGDDPRAAIVAIAVVVSLSHLALALALAHLFRGGPLLAATVLAWIAASPYRFWLSRVAWDQLADPCAALAVALLAVSARLTWRVALPLGAVLGLALGTHPIAVPFALSVGLVLGWELRRDRGALARVLAPATAASLAVVAPYLVFLAQAPRGPLPPRAFSLALLARYVVEVPRVATVSGTAYFFDHEWTRFLAWSGPLRVLTDLGGGWVAAAFLVGVSGIALALRFEDARQRRLARLALLTWLAAPLAYALSGRTPHPHYQAATWWVIPFGLAATLAWIEDRRSRWSRWAFAAAWTVAALQFAFVVTWMSYVRAHGGTRGIHYGTPIGGQRALMRSACAGPADVVLRNETNLFQAPLVYWAAVRPECQGKSVRVCGANGVRPPTACPGPTPGTETVRLVYAHDGGGALALK
jgi:hypothetical protein